jgi:RNase H-like domain found in reverse transcriptase
MGRKASGRIFTVEKQTRHITSILSLPRDDGHMILDTDESNHSLGLVLSQMQDNEAKILAHASRRYSKGEANYCVTHKVLLAIIYCLRQFHSYLLGRQFIIRMDHAPLLWLYRTPEPIGQQGRCLT